MAAFQLITIFGACAFIAGNAAAETRVSTRVNEAVTTTQNTVNLRIGRASNTGNARPTICVEAGAYGFTAEACGTGSGVLHDDPGGEMAHFRVKWRAWHQDFGNYGGLRAQVGAGFAELEVGEDKPGFTFSQPDVGVTAVAGPESSISLQWIHSPALGIDLIASATAGVAYFRHAARLLAPHSKVQPFVSLELGLGW